MIGVTITSGGEYKTICDEAVRRFKKHTGVKTVVIIETDEKDRKYSFFTKLRLHTMFPNVSFVFFDADLWFIKDIDLTKYDNSDSFHAVKDVGRDSQVDFPIHDCHLLGMEKERYFNSGLFIANGRNKQLGEAFEFSSFLFQRVKPFDFGEQSVLNAAIQRYNVPVEYLDSSLNYPIICDQQGYKKPQHIFTNDPYAIHALGYKAKHKALMLNQYINRNIESPFQIPDPYLYYYGDDDVSLLPSSLKPNKYTYESSLMPYLPS